MSAILARLSNLALEHLKTLDVDLPARVHPLVQLAIEGARGLVQERLVELSNRPSSVQLLVPDWAAVDSGAETLDDGLARLAERLRKLSAVQAAAVLADYAGDSLRTKYPDFAPQ